LLAYFDFCASAQLTTHCTFWDTSGDFAPSTSPVIDEGSLPFYLLENLHLPMLQPKDAVP
jgi:hypothetical protein